ncbi:protein translocase subunit SecF [Patescibacteria group bacterium]|nr:MAG: protein translocase subunit SecF [Patescibacteria group bacterium]
MTSTFSFVGWRKYWFAVSAISILLSIGFLVVFGLKFSADFTGGSLIELEFAQGAPPTQEVKQVLTSLKGLSVQSADENQKLILRSEAQDEATHQATLATLRETFGEFTELRFDSIGPTVGSELRRSSIIGVLVTLLLIGLYISWAFRKVSEPIASWKYGLITVLCAAHDVIIPLGVFALLGQYYHWEIGSGFVAAILTILGYSISDTVVVFDRTRENLLQHRGEDFPVVVERSIRETFTRSVNTSLTTLLALTAVFFFGGESTQPFALALMIGIAVGTYSSIFFASPLLVTWELYRKS